MIEINIGNIGDKEKAIKICDTLNGKTYYDFKATYGVCAGNYPVTVYTDYAGATEEEVKDMLLFVLACEI